MKFVGELWMRLGLVVVGIAAPALVFPAATTTGKAAAASGWSWAPFWIVIAAIVVLFGAFLWDNARHHGGPPTTARPR